jgi:ferric-dicitrate binding protein FerR (iron transport regulator)
MENNMQIEKLTEKFRLGTISYEEMVFLLNYLKDKEPRSEILVYYQNVWDKAEEYRNDINSQSLYNQITRTIGISSDGSMQSKERRKEISLTGNIKSIMRYAAVFILTFGLSWLVHGYFWNKTATSPIADQIQKVEVPLGSKSRIILPDGSVVTLNSGSSLKYSTSNFNSGSRSVFLTGEGFFSIAKDSARPFYATTTGIKVKVLGTTFNIKAYPDENIEEATVVTGEVEIYASSDKKEKGKLIVLKPNQKAVFIKSENDFLPNDNKMASPIIKPATLKTVNLQTSSKIEQTISWKEDKLIFDNEPFSNLVIRIERWYNVKIEVKYQELNSARFTGKFDKETLEQVLNALVTVTPFKYTIKQNIITITKN